MQGETVMIRKVDYDHPTNSNGVTVLNRIAALRAVEKYEGQPAAGRRDTDHESHTVSATDEIQLTLVFNTSGGGGSSGGGSSGGGSSGGGRGVGRIAVAEQPLPPPPLPQPPTTDLHQLQIFPEMTQQPSLAVTDPALRPAMRQICWS